MASKPDAATSGAIAVITGGSRGIGFELARCCVRHGWNVIIAADDSEIEKAAQTLREMGAKVEAVQTDISTTEGVDKLLETIGGRPVEALLSNAGHGLSGAFLDQEWTDARHLIDTHVTGALYLIQKIGRDMRSRKRGRILITGSIAGFMPGMYQAVYNAAKAFLQSFSFALRHELAGDGVTVTCLMPGATDTDFFERADLTDTPMGKSPKDDPAEVAEQGFQAMLRGDGDIVPGWHNKVMSAIAALAPSDVTAALHGQVAAPGSAGD